MADPLVRSQVDSVLRSVRSLSKSPRPAGAPDSLRSLEIVRESIERTRGYDTEVQTFEFSRYVPESWELSIESKAVECLPALCSASTPKLGIQAEVVNVRSEVEGKIALVEVKDIHESTAVEAVAEKGAVGALVFQERGPLYSGRVRYPRSSIPALTLSSQEGLAISAAIRTKRRLGCFLRLRARSDRSIGRNVFGRPRRGRAPALYVAHRDSRIFSPGAIDNATGSALLLHTASLGPQDYLLSTDTEEYGLIGAKSFVVKNEWLKPATSIVNLDSIGAGSLSLVTRSRGGDLSPDLNSKISTVAKEAGIRLGAISLPRGSDCDVFMAKGYRSSWVRAYPSPTATTVDDTYAHVRPAVVRKAVTLLNSLAGVSFRG